MAPEDPTEIVDEVADRALAADREPPAGTPGAGPGSTPDADEGPDDPEERGAVDEVQEWQDRVAAAALSPRAHAALTESRDHLNAAWQASDAGTESAPAGKLRHAHKAALVGMRHVTSHQVPFNRELVVAVDRLTRVVEELATRLEVVDEMDDRSATGLRRLQAGVATLGVQLDDGAGELADLAEVVADLADRLGATERALAHQRQVVGSTRAREDLVLRTLRAAAADATPADAMSTDGEPAEADARLAPADRLLAADAREAVAADAALLRRLAAAGHPRSEVVVDWARQLEPVVAAAAAGAPVVDLDSDRGEWLDVWATLDGPARGTESDPAAADLLRERGHQVAVGDPAELLATLPAGSVGAVTSVALADVRPLGELVAVVDASVAALRPGGALVLVAADPAGAPVDILWADLRRRPVHPETLVLLALDRGFAEADVVALTAPDGAAGDGPRAYALVARAPGGGPA